MQISVIAQKAGATQRQIRKIIASIRGRNQKYGKVGISRTEHEFFGMGEIKLRRIIEVLRDIGFINKIGMEKCGKYKCNIYALCDFIFKTIEDLNHKIVEWNNRVNPVHALKNFGIIVDKSGRIKQGVTVNKRTGQITDWKQDIHWNLFNYIRMVTNKSPYSLALYLGIR